MTLHLSTSDRAVPGALEAAPIEGHRRARKGVHRKRWSRRTKVRATLVVAGVLLCVASYATYRVYAGLQRELAPADPQQASAALALLDDPSAAQAEIAAGQPGSSADTSVMPSPAAGSTPSSRPAVWRAAVASGAEYTLVLGVDRRSPSVSSRSDTVIIVRTDRATRSVSLLSIPRAMRVELEGLGYRRLSSAYYWGGPALAIKEIKEYTGLPIHHYCVIDFWAFVDVVDAMGGVWVTLDRPITVGSQWAGSPSGIRSVRVIPAGRQKLDGAAALTLVRSRYMEGSDFARIGHQQQLVKEVATQALSAGNALRLPTIVSAFARNVDTDMSVKQLMSFADAYRGFSGSRIRSYTIPGKRRFIDGVWYVIPDEEAASAVLESFAAGK